MIEGPEYIERATATVDSVFEGIDRFLKGIDHKTATSDKSGTRRNEESKKAQ